MCYTSAKIPQEKQATSFSSKRRWGTVPSNGGLQALLDLLCHERKSKRFGMSRRVWGLLYRTLYQHTYPWYATG